MNKRYRQYAGLLSAVLAYYLIHEGAHLVSALCMGVFRGIRIMGLGVQIDVHAGRMTDVQMGIFCLAGAVAALAVGYLLTCLADKIGKSRSKVFKACMYYITLALLAIDPVYLSVLCGFFGGGDMNGIKLLFPEIAVRILFAIIGIIHGTVVWKYLLPAYTKSFQEGSNP